MDRKIKKKKWPPRRIAVYLLSTAFIVFVAYSFITESEGSKLNVRAERLAISEVTIGPFLEFTPVTGTIIPKESINFEAAEGGRVKTIHIEAGNFVTEGDIILELENTSLQLEYQNRESQFIDQENNLNRSILEMQKNFRQWRQDIMNAEYTSRRSQRNFEKNRSLLGMGALSRFEFEQSKEDYEQNVKRETYLLEKFGTDSLLSVSQIKELRSSLERTKNSLEFLKERVENLKLKAPISGLLTSLEAELGQSVNTGRSFGRIDIINEYRVRANVGEHYIARVNVGQEATYKLSNYEGDLLVDRVYPEVRNSTFQVDFEFVERDFTRFRRGQTLSIRISLSNLTESVQIPTGGFFEKTGGNWIFVVDESGEKATKRFIKLGRKNTEAYEIVEGLEIGEKVITSSYNNFGDNDILILKY
ncbi:efflux RND transporter periplasmic adaptor subunit [candidate division KSB1 bacterium]